MPVMATLGFIAVPLVLASRHGENPGRAGSEGKSRGATTYRILDVLSATNMRLAIIDNDFAWQEILT